MFDPNAIVTTQQSQIQYQQQPQQAVDDKSKVVAVSTQDGTKQEFVPFGYANVNMIQTKIAPNTSQAQHSTVNMSQLTDDKCYITQPFSYNYTLVNQNLLTQNTISNITFKCDVCGLMFAHLSLLNHHKKVHHGQSDQNQPQQQQITVQLMPTQVQQTQQPTQIQIVSADRIRFSCDQCGMTFATQNELKTHKNQQHQTQQQQQTQVQQQQQQTQQQPAAQQQQQTQPQQTQQPAQQQPAMKVKNCESCGTQLPADSNKKRAVMKVKCENCLTAESIQPQIFVVAAEPQVKYEEGGTQTGGGEFGGNRDQLGTQNTIPIGVKGHHHPVKRRGVASVTKCTKCNGSGIIFIGGNKNPQRDADKPFHCNICNGSFSRYSSLWSHKRLHTGEKNFKCNICGLAFAKAAYLKNHSRIHTGEKPYRCNVCGMQFSQSPHLKNHERIHSGERPYVCEVCDKSFARHSTLWNHRRIHTGEKPYKCDTCGSCFNQATHLKNHQKVHSGEKPFKCDICSVGFSDRFALKRHRQIHEKYARNKIEAQAAADDPTAEEGEDEEHMGALSGEEPDDEEELLDTKFEPADEMSGEEMADISELHEELQKI